MILSERFFKAADELNSFERHVNAPYIRKNYDLTGAVKAEVAVGATGFYDLFVNGQKITKGLLAPYISNPDHAVYYDRYEVTERLLNGENVFGLILGNGMQNCPGGRVWDFDIAKFRGAPSFAFSLTVTYADGREETFEADESFRCAPSPILFDDLRAGCFYDANLEQPGWNAPGFDDSGWQPVKKAETPRGESVECHADPVVVTEERAPVKVYEGVLSTDFDNRENMRLDTQYKFDVRGKTGVVYDFGVNVAGIIRLNIDGKPGRKILIQLCEHQKINGEICNRSIGSFYPDGYCQTVYYICKGEQKEIFEPPFTYFGFRFAVVYGLTPEQVKPETVTMLVANSDLKMRADYECSDGTMNTLRDMARRSDLANFVYFPTDCPHREKNGWTGDAAVSAERTVLMYTPEKSYLEWLANICRAQTQRGNIPCIIPTGGWGYGWGSGPAWDNALTELCWQMYRVRGELSAAKLCSEAMLRYLSVIHQRRRPDGLVTDGLGDWLQPGKGAGGHLCPTELSSSIMCMYIAWKSARLFDALGLEPHRAFAETVYREFRAAIRASQIDFVTMTARARCQTAQAMCIYYNVFDEAEKPAACRSLVEMIHEKGDHFDTGMLGVRVIFHVLSDCGEGALAYHMITREDWPSYGSMIKQGLTALGEDFIPPEDWDDPNSLNHHFMGDFSNWFLQRVAGIRVNPRLTGPDEIDIAPDFLPQLSFAKAHYDAPAGTVRVYWYREEDAVKLSVECPDAVKGYIELPRGYVFHDETDRWSNLHGAKRTPLKTGVWTAKVI
ncbi:MAG: family 78 glycoside hydrolase catalytic domain [Clostridia bacterium]|nr:family 78 glycoside hydrolase catalytic domain [Clostridia bacterium]